MRAPINRSRPRRVAALVLAVVGAIVLGDATAQGSSHAPPRLTVTTHSPVTVRGSGFKARKRVRVTLTIAQTFVRRPLANGSGAFTVTFPTAIDRCSSWYVSATVNSQVVAFVRGPKPLCPPA